MATLYVRKDGSTPYTTIQSAIYDAQAGDIVDVGPGTFYENVELYKSISLLGAGRDLTVIQGKTTNDTFVCSWFAGDSIVTTASTTGAQRGKNITGTNVTSGSRIDAILSETQLRLSQPTLTTGNYSKVVSAYQTVSFSVSPTSGTFKLSYNGVETAAINWNDGTSTIQTKLRAIAGLSTVVVTGTISSRLLTIAFDGVATPVLPLSVSSNLLAPSVVITPTLKEALTTGSTTIMLPNTTSVVVGHKVEGPGVDAVVTALNTTAKTITISNPITETSSGVTLSFRVARSNITLTQVINPSASSVPASMMVYGTTTDLTVKDLSVIGFDWTPGQESSALGLTAGTAPGHVNSLFDNCRFTAVGDCAVITGSNPHLDGGTWQNCIFDGKTFIGDEPADVPAFSSFTIEGVVQSIGASSSVITVPSLRGIIVTSTLTSPTWSGTGSVTAISGMDITVNKVVLGNVGDTISLTFTLVAYKIPNVARNLVYIGQNISPSNTKNIVFRNNVVSGQTGAVISATGDKTMFNSAVTIESIGGLVENNLIDGLFGAGEPNPLMSNWAIRCRQAGTVVQNNVNKVGPGRENSGYFIGTEFGLNIGTNITDSQVLVSAIQQAAEAPVVIDITNSEILQLPKVEASEIFSDQANWELVGVVYKHSDSALRFTPGYAALAQSKAVALKPGMESGQTYLLWKLILSDESRQLLVVYRADLANPSSYDFTLK